MYVGDPLADLVMAIGEQDFEVVARILDTHPNLVNNYSAEGFPIIMYAWESLPMVTLLVRRGADVNFPRKGGGSFLTCLDMNFREHLREKHTPTMCFLVDEGAHITDENSKWLQAYSASRQRALQARRTAAAALVSVLKQCGVLRDLQRVVGRAALRDLDWREWRK